MCECAAVRLSRVLLLTSLTGTVAMVAVAVVCVWPCAAAVGWVAWGGCCSVFVMDRLEWSGLAAVDVDVCGCRCRRRVWAARGCCLALELRRFGRGPVAQAQLGSAPTA
jgi:hypothetical protein